MIVEFTLAAEAELDEAVAYFNAQRAGIGIDFAREVQSALVRFAIFRMPGRKSARGRAPVPLRRVEYGLV